MKNFSEGCAAKGDRNRLFHSFFREHNFRRDSAGGRALMLQDLETIHEKIINAYKAVMKLSALISTRFKCKACPQNTPNMKQSPNNAFNTDTRINANN